MKQHIAIMLVLLTSGLFIAGCLNEGSANPKYSCPEFVEPAIKADMQRYSPAISSAPGLPFRPDLGAVNASACGYLYRWTASDGHFLRWEPPTFQVNEEGKVVVHEYGPVYWTWYDDSQVQGKNVTITLEVLDPAGARVLARTERGISWDGVEAVVKPNVNPIGDCRFINGEKKKE